MADTAEIGHNNPPAYDPEALAAEEARAREFADAAGAFLDLGELDNEDDAQRLNDYIAGARKVRKAIDDARKAAKKPHDDAGKEVQAAFTPIIETVDRSVKRVQPMLTAWLDKKEAERKALEEKQRQEAEAAAKAAEEAAERAAGRNDIAGEVEAEEAAKRAEEMRKEADRTAKSTAKVASATGGTRSAGLRTVRSARITNVRMLFQHYSDRPEVEDVLLRLANADIRSKDVDETAIPGIEIIETRKAV